MPEYRPLPGDRDDEFAAAMRYAFSPENGPPEDDADDRPPEIGERRGLFDETDDLLSVCRHYWFPLSVRGEWLPAAGLSAVATPPEHRHRGYVRRTLAASLREYRDEGKHLAALWPFEYGFYRSFGWDTGSKVATTTLSPDLLSFAAGSDSDREFITLSGEDFDRVAPIHRTHGARYDLTMDRSEGWWRHRTLHDWSADPYAYGVERGGDLTAYIVYSMTSTDDGRRLDVEDHAFVDREAFRDLLAFLHSHDSQVSSVRIQGPPESDILDLVERPGASSPRDATCEFHTGAMVRLVDVAAALSALPAPSGGGGEVVLGVSDPLASWNDGAFALSVDDGAVECEHASRDPDVRLDVGALSQLAVGYRTVDALDREGRLSFVDGDARERLSAAFPPGNPWLREGF